MSSNFYFALPRLLARSRQRSEKNAAETNFVGILLHIVVYCFAFEVLLGTSPLWTQLVLAIPVAFVVWLFWLLFFYVSNLVIHPFRPRRMAAAQSISMCSLTSACAVFLLVDGSWTRWIGVIWLTLVALNLVATSLLRNE